MSADDEDQPAAPLEHDPYGDRWQRHVDPESPRRDRSADRETARAIAAEEHGEWTPDGFRPSTWE